MRWTPSLLSVLLVACGSGSASSDAAKPAALANGGRIEAHGLTLRAAAGWTPQSAEPVAGWPIVVSVSSGAHGESLALLEIARRPETDPDIKRRPAEHLVTELVLAWSGTFASIDASGGPEAATLAGEAATLIRATVTTLAVDGTDLLHTARFYGFKAAGAAWVVRAIGPADGTADADLDAMLASVQIGDR